MLIGVVVVRRGGAFNRLSELLFNPEPVGK